MTVLAVDLGSTGCRVALWRGDAVWRADGPGAPGLAEPGAAAQAEVAIAGVAAGLLRAAGSDAVDIAAIGAAGAAAAPAAARELAERLARRLPAPDVRVTSDAVATHAGALGGQAGVVLVLGSGAVAVAVGPDGAVHRVDGLGSWLGDEGGEAAIGRAGLQAALRAREGRGPATVLEAEAERQFGTLAALPGRVATAPVREAAALFAIFAPAVAEAAGGGDAVAGAILAEATSALIATVTAARRRLPAEPVFPFAMVGGLEALVLPLRAALAGLRLSPVSVPGSARDLGLDGARRLATDAADRYGDAVQRVRAAGAGAADALDLLATEGVRPGLEDLDQRRPAEVVALSLAAERAAQDAVAAAGPALGALADAVAARLGAGGRLFYLGAGTPGRLAVLDAAELAPTYRAPPGLVVALLAGGPGAMLEAVEGAEDDDGAAAAALDAHGLSAADAVVGIAASGRTPFVVGGLRHARARGALTGAIVNNPFSPAAAVAAHAVEMLTGPEIVAGSTRMMAGTAQKIALNALSTACMVALGKTYGSRMVDVRASNDKLRRRARRTVQEVAGCSPEAAVAALAATGGRVKPALVMLLAGLDAEAAELRLLAAGGRVRDAVLPP